MSYGINAPQGLKPHSYMNGSPWNGATQSLPIMSGQATSIYTGDLVTWDNTTGTAAGATGGIRCATGVAADFASTTVPLALGVFMGCRYRQYVGGLLQEFNSPYWPGGTVVAPISTTTNITAFAEAFVVTDPNVLFDIQVSSSIGNVATLYGGIAQKSLGLNAYLGLGIIGSAGNGSLLNSVTQLQSANGTSLQNNPTTGNQQSGLSGVYLDIGGGANGTLGIGGTTQRTQCKIIGLTPRVDQFNNLNTPLSLADDFATGPMKVAGSVPAQVSNGSFNNVLVRLNYHFFGTSTVANPS
jgi:hypothetical protein